MSLAFLSEINGISSSFLLSSVQFVGTVYFETGGGTSEHHMVEQDLLHLTLAGYLLGSSFCRLKLQRGGVCIFLGKISVLAQLVSHITVKSRIWKYVQFN